MSFLVRGNKQRLPDLESVEVAAEPVEAEVVSVEISEASTDQYQVVKEQVYAELLELLGPTLYDPNISEAELEQKVRETLLSTMSSLSRDTTAEENARIQQEITDDILGYGPLEPLLRDNEISEVMVNGHRQVYVEKSGLIQETGVRFASEAHLRRTIEKIVSKVGRRVDESSPLVDARLPDGSRVNAVIPPIALSGSSLTIRKFAATPYTYKDLIRFGTLPETLVDFLDRCVRGRMNIIISGGTGSGKTTLLNVVSSFLPENERIVTIEDVAELRLQQRHVVTLEARPANTEGSGQISIRSLVGNSLRMRPDRIVIGEVRDGAALDLLQAMNTGHDGSLTTLHSNGPRDTISRLETMALMSGMELPVRVIREQVASAINLIVHQARLKDGTRRVTHVTEVVGMESDVVTTQDLFVFDFSQGLDEHGKFKGMLRPTGIRPKFSSRLHDMGIELPPALFGGY